MLANPGINQLTQSPQTSAGANEHMETKMPQEIRTTCPTCDGIGTQNDGNPNDPRSRLVTCQECRGTGLPDCDACAAQDGAVCDGGPRTCASAHMAALDAGIPLEVIRGEKTL